jgi:hypothetical protein
MKMRARASETIMDFISVLLSRLSPLSALVPTVVRVDNHHLNRFRATHHH